MYEEIKNWEYRVQSVGRFFSGVKAEELEELLNECPLLDHRQRKVCHRCLTDEPVLLPQGRPVLRFQVSKTNPPASVLQ